VDGSYQVGCAGKIMEKNCNWSDSKMSDIKGANKLRESLLNNNEYLEYSKTLPKRNASIKLEILPDSSIMVFDVKIGRFHQLVKGSVSTTYRVMNEKNKPLATINYEPGRRRVFIRTLNDNAGKEYFIGHEFGHSDIYDAVAYLVDYGYL
jgi:hypothetical protein